VDSNNLFSSPAIIWETKWWTMGMTKYEESAGETRNANNILVMKSEESR
jgi:hypothetical protein